MYIIIIGCGKFGSNLAKELSDSGNDVSIIDRDGEKLNALGSGFNGHRIKGIEYDSDNLFEAGVNKADALVAVTADDNINITVSLIADKIFHVPQIISRVNDPEKSFFYHKVGIDTINPIQYEIEILKSKLDVNSLETISTLDNNYEILNLLVDKDKSHSVSEIEKKYRCIISGIMVNGVLELPDKEELINNGDRLICTVHKDYKGKLINNLCKETFL